MMLTCGFPAGLRRSCCRQAPGLAEAFGEETHPVDAHDPPWHSPRLGALLARAASTAPGVLLVLVCPSTEAVTRGFPS